MSIAKISNPRRADANPLFRQDWLKCMDEFADLMELIETVGLIPALNPDLNSIRLAADGGAVAWPYT